MTKWDYTVMGLSEPEKESTMRYLFFEQVKDCKSIAQEISIHKAAAPGAHERSYAYIESAVRKYIDRQQRASTRDALKKGLAGPTPPGLTTAAPATDTAGAKSARRRGSRDRRRVTQAAAAAHANTPPSTPHVDFNALACAGSLLWLPQGHLRQSCSGTQVQACAAHWRCRAASRQPLSPRANARHAKRRGQA